MNFKAMETTRSEYLASFSAVKGAKYAEFMNRALGVLACSEAISEALRPEDKSAIGLMVATLTSIAFSSLAREAGIPRSDHIAALQECKTMLNSIGNASALPPGVC